MYLDTFPYEIKLKYNKNNFKKFDLTTVIFCMYIHWCAKLKQQCTNLADSHEIAEKEIWRLVQ